LTELDPMGTRTPADDLATVLDARTPLLKRAFSNVGLSADDGPEPA
jgi:hypothetical protein